MTVDMDTHAYWRPEGGGAFLGMGVPEAASEPAVDVPVDWTFPAVAMDAAGRLVPFWRDLAGRLTGAEVSVAAGQYTVTADGRPIIGATGGLPACSSTAATTAGASSPLRKPAAGWPPSSSPSATIRENPFRNRGARRFVPVQRGRSGRSPTSRRAAERSGPRSPLLARVERWRPRSAMPLGLAPGYASVLGAVRSPEALDDP